MNKNMLHTALLSMFVVAPALVAGACSDDAINYSSPVGISLQFKSSDVVAGRILIDKNINTESGNPYGAFVKTAETKIGGTPGRIDVVSATLTVDSSSNQVTRLGEVFAGECKLSFVLNSGNAPLAVATRTMVAADPAGPVTLTAAFDSATLDSVQYAQLVAGSFKVALDCVTAAPFASLSATADIKATFTFGAYE